MPRTPRVRGMTCGMSCASNDWWIHRSSGPRRLPSRGFVTKFVTKPKSKGIKRITGVEPLSESIEIRKRRIGLVFRIEVAGSEQARAYPIAGTRVLELFFPCGY